MKEIDFEFSNNLLKKVLRVIVFSFVIFIVIWSLFNKNKNSLYNDSFDYSKKLLLKENYNAVVAYKDYNKENHNNPTIYFTNGSSIVNGDFWAIIKENDSLVKNKNDLFITV